jgi:hypothetical protein
MLDSSEGICAGQSGFEYPATSVPFSNGWLHNRYPPRPAGSSRPDKPQPITETVDPRWMLTFSSCLLRLARKGIAIRGTDS